jgi:hypothetical protein
LIVRWQKNNDYRIVRIYRDLVGDWVVEQCWGDGTRCHQRRTLVESRMAARAMMLKINREHRSRGFRPVTWGEEQLELGF